MLQDFTIALQLNPRFQPYFYRLKHFLTVVKNRKCFTEKEDKSANFLFIVGCGRSGNTLLRKILIEQFDIYLPPETYVLPQQINQYSVNTGLRWPERVDTTLCILENHSEFETFNVKSFADFKAMAKNWPEDNQTFVELVKGLYRWLGNQHDVPCQWVGDKTPLNTLNLGLLNWAFPNAKFIYLERDPVDVVQSYLNAGIYKTASEAAERWRNSVRSWESFKKLKMNKDFLEFKYEKFVVNPEELIEKISDSFFIPKRKIKIKLSNLQLGDVGVRDHHSNVPDAPSSKAIGKGRKNISAENLDAMLSVLGELPQKRGYEKL